jgi:hypothetical protein
MTIGAFQNDAFDGIGFQIDYQVGLDATEKRDSVSFTLSAINRVSLFSTEKRDTVSFSVGIIGYAEFDVTEKKDTASFTVTAFDDRFVEFAVTEKRDTASFTTTARNLVEFAAEEKRDTVTFNIDVRTEVFLNATEKRDVAYFRTFAAFFTDGDTDYIHLQPEQRTAIVPHQIDRATVPYSMRASVPSENQTISVAQTQLQRKARE